MTKFEQWEAACNDVDGAETADALVQALANRGLMQSGFGFAAAGLEDLLRAHAQYGDKALQQGLLRSKLTNLLQLYRSKGKQKTVPGWLNAQLGEALRVYARDVLLSGNDSAAVDHAVSDAIACFENAEKVLAGQPGLAWVIAHRGAAHMMQYWMTLVQDPHGGAALFKAAKGAFESAIEISRTYTWSKRFLAFLYALRAASHSPPHHSYVVEARMLLESLSTDDKYDQSSLDRSIAMLYSYDTFLPDAGDESAREQSAKDSFSRAAEAVEKDPEDFMASYSGAASLWYLARRPGASLAGQDRSRAAIESAWTRSMNTISQATATLAGLAIMRGRPRESERVLGLFEHIELDLETRAMMALDPVFRPQEPEAVAHRNPADEHFKELRRKYSIDP